MNKAFIFSLTMALTTCLVACTPTPKKDGHVNDWHPLFNGKDLSGWQVKAHETDLEKSFFTVENGAIIAEATSSDHDYVWLYSDKQYLDFHLTLQFQIERGDYTNSGVQFRSRYDHADSGGWLNGPQVDIGATDRNGSIWDETRNNQRWLVEDYSPKTFYYADQGSGWNDLEILVEGNRVRVIQNGQQITDYDGSGVLNDTNHQSLAVGQKGHIALQIHTEDIMKIKYRSIKIKELNVDYAPLDILVFSKTAGYVHDSIVTIENEFKAMGKRNGWQVTTTRDSMDFTPQGLAKYDIVFWNNNCADTPILNKEERMAFQFYVENGGGYAGIHGAAWSHFSPRWDWYIDTLLGAQEINKNGIWEGVWNNTAKVYAENAEDPITAMVPFHYEINDEYYSMSRDVRAPQPAYPDDQVEVLISAIADWDYGDFRTGHPVTWRRTVKAGRMWYSAIGHNHSTIQDPVFSAHMEAGIRWAAGQLD